MVNEPTTRNITSRGGGPVTRQPLPRWTVPIVAGSISLISITVLVFLWAWVNRLGLGGKDLATAQLEVIKVVTAIAVGGGGLFALYLAARRQHTQELELAQREDVHVLAVHVAENTEKDAAARRVTELYAKAVEQVGSDKAPVRLGGLYALRRLAQDDPRQRQTIVDVLCAYLRMPFVPPGEQSDRQISADEAKILQHRNEEQQVRLAAQRILATHLVPERSGKAVEAYWPDIDLDLTGATLIDLVFSNCRLRTALFDRVTVIGVTDFSWTTFTGDVTFRQAQLGADARFWLARFDGSASFDGTIFHGKLDFYSSIFKKSASFRNVRCEAEARFNQASFGCEGALAQADFSKAHFCNEANFGSAEFDVDVHFIQSQFEDKANFSGAKFTRIIRFDNATYAENLGFNSILDRNGQVRPMSSPWVRLDVHSKMIRRRSWPPGWSVIAHEGRPADDDTSTWGHLIKLEDDEPDVNQFTPQSAEK